VRTLELRQGTQVGCLEEIAYQQGWIDDATLAARAALFKKNNYGKYLAQIGRQVE
jgi:Glucose-1-phosphate thymidylyltransferase (EC 2.7.7.24)